MNLNNNSVNSTTINLCKRENDHHIELYLREHPVLDVNVISSTAISP